MAERAVERMGIAAFLLWAEGREERFELVDGVPQRRERPTRRHDRIVVNLLMDVGRQVSSRQCEAFTADTAVVVPSGNVRLPDVGVDCGEADDESRQAKEPVLVVEVLSPSTRDVDRHGKLEEYKAVASMRHILLVDAERPWAALWSRGAGGVWSEETVSGADAVLRLPALGLELPFPVMYERVSFRAGPRLIG